MEKSALFHSPVSELGNAVVIVVSSVFLSNGYSSLLKKRIVYTIIKVFGTHVQYDTLARANVNFKTSLRCNNSCAETHCEETDVGGHVGGHHAHIPSSSSCEWTAKTCIIILIISLRKFWFIGLSLIN